MPINLSTTTSIVDYLNTLGKPSDFGSRSGLYKEKGLESRLGKFTGTPEQNTALLNLLRQESSQSTQVQPSVQDLSGQLEAARQQALGIQSSLGTLSNLGYGGTNIQNLPANVDISQLPNIVGQNLPPIDPFALRPGQSPRISEAPTLKNVSAPPNVQVGEQFQDETGETFIMTTQGPQRLSLSGFAPYTAQGGETLDVIANKFGITKERLLEFNPKFQNVDFLYRGEQVVVPQSQTPGDLSSVLSTVGAGLRQGGDTISGLSGMSAQEALSIFGFEGYPTAEEITQKVFESEDFQLFQKRQEAGTTQAKAEAEAEAAALENKFAAEKSSLEEKLAANGLAFSGIRATQVKSLADELAASQLGIDRKLASILLDANFDLREEIMRQSALVVKEAEQGREEAIAQLNKVGLAVIGNTLVPTLAATQEERQQRAADLADARFELQQAQFEVSTAKSAIQIEQAQQRLDQAERRLALEEEKATTGGKDIDSKAQQIVSGFSKLSDFPLSEQSEIRDKLFKLGFGSDIVPDWFKEILKEEYSNQSLNPEFMKVQWDEFRKDVNNRLIDEEIVNPYK